MRVWQPGGHLSSIKKVEVDDWSWRRTRRRIAELARLTKPYKARTALSIVSLLAATATALAPPLLAKFAIDDAISKNDLGLLWWIVGAFVVAGLAELGDELRADLPHGLGRRAHPGRPAHRALPPSPAALPRFLRAHPRGRDHQPADERRRGDRPARHGRRHEPRPEQPHADRHGDPPLRPRLAARARDAARSSHS